MVKKSKKSEEPVEVNEVSSEEPVEVKKAEVWTYLVKEGKKVAHAFVRAYSEDVHGKDYKKLAEKFIKNHSDKQYLVK